MRTNYDNPDFVILKNGQKITKEEFYNLFIEQNLTKEYLCGKYNIGLTLCSQIAKHFHIKKDPVNVTKNAKKTFLKKYGVENISQAKEIKDKKKESALRKYGVENISQSEEIKNKKEKHFMEKYGEKCYLNTKEYIQTIREKNLKKYGVEWFSQLEDVKQKVQHTTKEKYGVDWPCQIYDTKIYSNNSLPNLKFEKHLEHNNISFEREFSVNGYTYDFIVGNTLIEIDPCATHNTVWSPFGTNHVSRLKKDYHFKKTENAKNNDYKCIHVWDWDNIDGVLNIINNKNSIYARNTIVKEVPLKESNAFLDQNHVQRSVKSCVQIGLYYYDELVSVMTFGKPRYNKKYQWELLRYCSIGKIIGGAKKLFTYFLKNFNPENILSYCDLSKFNGDIYNLLGFSLLRKSAPTIHWYNMKTKEHYTDNLIRSRGPSRIIKNCEPEEDEDYGTTNNYEIMLMLNFLPVYDCGQATYIWNKKG